MPPKHPPHSADEPDGPDPATLGNRHLVWIEGSEAFADIYGATEYTNTDPSAMGRKLYRTKSGSWILYTFRLTPLGRAAADRLPLDADTVFIELYDFDEECYRFCADCLAENAIEWYYEKITATAAAKWIHERDPAAVPDDLLSEMTIL